MTQVMNDPPFGNPTLLGRVVELAAALPTGALERLASLANA